MVFFCFLWYLRFPGKFFLFKKTFGKTAKTNKTKPISKGGSETFKTLFLLVFPKVLLVFFGFLWYCWFSRSFLLFSKNLRENKKNKQGLQPHFPLPPLLLSKPLLVFRSAPRRYAHGYGETQGRRMHTGRLSIQMATRKYINL